MSTAVGIIAAIIILGIIVIVHEMGHFILARINGIAVPEFTVGFGPRLCGFKVGETEFNLRLIPLGGACRMMGEDGDNIGDERAFTSKSVSARFSTIFAGPLFNFILAFVLAIIIIGVVGYDPCVVTYVEEGSAAEAAGLQVGDLITSYDGDKISIGRELAIRFSFEELDGHTVDIDYVRFGDSFHTRLTPELSRSYKLGFYYNAGQDAPSINSVIEGGVFAKAGIKAGDVITSINGHAVATGEDLYNYIRECPLTDSEIEVTFMRDGVTTTLFLHPEYSESYSLGFNYNYNGREKTTPLNVIKYSFIEVKYWIVNTVKSLGGLFTGKVGADDLGGPVRIVSELEETVEQTKDDGILYVVLNLLNWGILLSANLGVMNLLPLPALDGGRLVFIIIEAIRRKPVPPEKEGLVHGIGIIILLILMVFVFFNDLRNVFF